MNWLQDKLFGNKDEELLAATLQGDAVKVQTLLKAGANCQARGEQGRTALFEAALYDHTEVSRLLLEYGANPNATCSSTASTALEVAAARANLPLLRLLLEKGATLHQPNNEGKTPLMAAVQSGNPGAVQLLLDRGADVSQTNRLGETAWHQAAAQEDLAMTAFLEERGAVPDPRLNYCSVLVQAGYEGDLEFVRSKLAGGIHVDSLDSEGCTALMRACQQGHLDTVRYLVGKGASPIVKNRRGWNAFSYAGNNQHEGSEFTEILNVLEQAASTKPMSGGL